jgi:hypothetical protein
MPLSCKLSILPNLVKLWIFTSLINSEYSILIIDTPPPFIKTSVNVMSLNISMDSVKVI